MNEKKAKELRRNARAQCEAAGIPLENVYHAIRHTVTFDGALMPWTNPTISTARRQKLDLQADIAKGKKYGVLPNLALEELFGPVRIMAIQVTLAGCMRGVYQRTKRALA